MATGAYKLHIFTPRQASLIPEPTSVTPHILHLIHILINAALTVLSWWFSLFTISSSTFINIKYQAFPIFVLRHHSPSKVLLFGYAGLFYMQMLVVHITIQAKCIDVMTFHSFKCV